jgi:hypothetical protein
MRSETVAEAEQAVAEQAVAEAEQAVSEQAVAEQAVAEAEQAVAGDDQADDDSGNPNAEAAKWRHRFRDEQNGHKETRTALESMTARVESLQRQHVEALLDAAKVKPAALWATTELAHLVAEDGTVDPKAVKTAIDAARKTLGINPVGKGTFVPGIGHHPEGLLSKQDGFADAFKPQRR